MIIECIWNFFFPFFGWVVNKRGRPLIWPSFWMQSPLSPSPHGQLTYGSKSAKDGMARLILICVVFFADVPHTLATPVANPTISVCKFQYIFFYSNDLANCSSQQLESKILGTGCEVSCNICIMSVWWKLCKVI